MIDHKAPDGLPDMFVQRLDLEFVDIQLWDINPRHLHRRIMPCPAEDQPDTVETCRNK